MFQLQTAIIRPTTERSPGTFSDCAQSLNVPGLRNTCRQKCCANGSGKKVKIQKFMYRDTMNVEPEMYDYTSNNWSHWNSNEKLKEKFGSFTRKTFDRFTTKDSYTWNITHNTESTAV